MLDISRWDVGAMQSRCHLIMDLEEVLSRKCSRQRDLRVLKMLRLVVFFFFLKDVEEGLDSRRNIREVVRMGILVAQWCHFCLHCI